MNKKVEISEELDQKIHTVFKEVIEQTASDFDCWNSSVEEIEHASYSGFWSWNNGGFNAMAVTDLYSVWSTGAYDQQGRIADTIDSCSDDIAESFFNENEAKLKSLWITKEMCTYHDLSEAGQKRLAEEFSDYEYTWLSEGGEFWYQARVIYYAPDNARNESGENEAYFMAGLNTDYGYGRDSGFLPSWSENVPLKDLTDEKLVEIKANLSKYISEEVTEKS